MQKISDDFLTLFSQKEAKRFKLKVGVFLFLIHRNHILLLRRYQTGIDDGQYAVPMGAIEGAETLTAAAIREAREEANVIIKPENLKMCHLMHRFHKMPQGISFEQLDIFFQTKDYEGEIKNLEPHKCDELKFYPLNNLPQNTIPFVRHAIRCMQNNESYSEFGWD